MEMLNLSAGLTTASGTPLPTPAGGAQPQENADTTSGGTGFGDALLNVISTLLAEQGQTLPRSNVSADATVLKEKDDEKEDARATPLPLKDDAPQQLLEALLMSSQMPVRTELPPPVAMAGNRGPALSLVPVTAGSGGNAPTLNPLMAATSPSATPVTPGAETAAPLPKEMQPVMPQPLHTLVSAGITPTVSNEMAPSTTAGTSGVAPSVMQHAPVQVDTEDNRWSQQLQSALGERLQLQVKNQVQHATIRLDPPEMGKIDIALQVDNGRVQVQISASHAEVYRALQQTSNDLRQSLTEQNFVQVNVQVSSQSGQQQGGKGHAFAGEQQAAILAGNDRLATDAGTPRHDHDPVLMTV